MSDNEEQKTVVAQISFMPDAQLMLQVAGIISDRTMFGLSCIGLFVQYLQEQHQAAAKPTIEVPKLKIARAPK